MLRVAERKREAQQWQENFTSATSPTTRTSRISRALFASAGTVDSVNVMRDMATGRARGFAFVEMATDEDAQKAISMLNDHDFGGRNLTVNEARPKAAPAAVAVRRRRQRRRQRPPALRAALVSSSEGRA